VQENARGPPGHAGKRIWTPQKKRDAKNKKHTHTKIRKKMQTNAKKKKTLLFPQKICSFVYNKQFLASETTPKWLKNVRIW
jgi:hypothetical protein